MFKYLPLKKKGKLEYVKKEGAIDETESTDEIVGHKVN
jgi:hypothetical protein